MSANPTTAPTGAALGRPLIREWHTMRPDEQAAEWVALVNWVAWIHDLYELSRTERLPRCWPQHPGLTEEVRSLKAWRELIYDTAAAASAPHTARSWHGELRQTIAAASSFWAPGCRVEHKDADPLDEKLRATWITQGPPVLDSAPEPAPPAAGDTISAQAMHDALTSGAARRHSPALPTAAHHQDGWWRRNDDATWTRVNDTEAAALDRSHRQITAADTAYQHINREDQQQWQI
jgi:hypothetical protein